MLLSPFVQLKSNKQSDYSPVTAFWYIVGVYTYVNNSKNFAQPMSTYKHAKLSYIFQPILLEIEIFTFTCINLWNVYHILNLAYIMLL